MARVARERHASPEDIRKLVRHGLLVWLDRTAITHDSGGMSVGIVVNVYLLTPKGLQICERDEIPSNSIPDYQ